MNKGDKEAASSRDAWGGSLPAEGAAQAGDSGRRWLSLDEDSSGPCGWNGGNEGESRNRPGSELSGARRGRAPLRSGASFLMPFGMPGWQMPCPVIGCQRSPPAWVVLCRGRQQSGGGLPFKLPAGHPAHVHRFLENPENSKGIPSPTRPWNFVWLHLDSGPGTFLSATFPPPQRQQ